MSHRLITVLYEDQHAPGETNYGPHMLMLACVADRTRDSRFALRGRVASLPCRGDGNVQRKLREDGDNLAARGPLIALFDDDKVRERYGLLPGATEGAVVKAICSDSQDSPTIVLLVRHMEDLVGACCEAMKRPRPAGKPKPKERDHILQAAANAPDATRAAILAAMPSFQRLVDVVHGLLVVDGGG